MNELNPLATVTIQYTALLAGFPRQTHLALPSLVDAQCKLRRKQCQNDAIYLDLLGALILLYIYVTNGFILPLAWS